MDKNNLLYNLLDFILHPIYTLPNKELSIPKKIYNVFWLVIWAITFSIILGIITSTIIGSNNPDKLTSLFDQESPLLTIILAALVAPLLEELTFRLPLIFKP